MTMVTADLVVGRSVAQPGSALASGARGREFESPRSDHSALGRLSPWRQTGTGNDGAPFAVCILTSLIIWEGRGYRRGYIDSHNFGPMGALPGYPLADLIALAL
jgi:hypothetical protein